MRRSPSLTQYPNTPLLAAACADTGASSLCQATGGLGLAVGVDVRSPAEQRRGDP
jgi:hypothetical protein